MLTSSRLRLRLLDHADAAWIAPAISNPDVHQWLTSVPYPYEPEMAQSYVTRTVGQAGYFVILRDDVPCGVTSVTGKSGFSAPFELGFWLAQSAWGHGVMTAATAAMLDRFFQSRDAVASGWIEGNRASEAVHRKLGFQPTGETRLIWSHFHGRDMPVTRVHLDRSVWADVDRSGFAAVAGATAIESKDT